MGVKQRAEEDTYLNGREPQAGLGRASSLSHLNSPGLGSLARLADSDPPGIATPAEMVVAVPAKP